MQDAKKNRQNLAREERWSAEKQIALQITYLNI